MADVGSSETICEDFALFQVIVVMVQSDVNGSKDNSCLMPVINF